MSSAESEKAEFDHWREQVARVYKDRRWLLAFPHAASVTKFVELLVGWGAPRPLVVSGLRGAGDLTDDADFHILDLEVGTEIMDPIQAFEAAHDALPGEAVAAIERWDPQRKARVLGPFFATGKSMAGRSLFGARPKEWQRLDDKTVVDELWDAVGVPRAPSAIVTTDLADLQAAAKRLDRGRGTVQAADNRDGFNGGASYLRWVRDAAEQREAQEFFREHAHRVRVMPFLEGIPCSIHGVVFEEAVAVLRPVEMVVFRKLDSAKLQYARASSFWDPSPADRREMRRVARSVGEHLQQHFDYRGVFTIDGVMTADGFRPTELNPRFGAALSVMLGPYGFSGTATLMHYALIEGEGRDWRPEEFERVMLERLDARRSSRVGFVAPTRIDEAYRAKLARSESAWAEVDDDAGFDAQVALDPMENGTLISITFNAETTPAGPFVAPRAAEIVQMLDRQFQLGIGPLEAPEDVRGF